MNVGDFIASRARARRNARNAVLFFAALAVAWFASDVWGFR